MGSTREVWQVRAVKPYPQARSHLFVGQVLDRDAVCVKLLCKTFRFGRVVNGDRGVCVGAVGRRIIPWGRVAMVDELPASFDFRNARLASDHGSNLVLCDGRSTCTVSSTGEGP